MRFRFAPFAECGLLIGLLLSLTTARADAGAWPMWRADAARSGAVSEGVPPDLHLQWVREYPPPKDAWPEDSALQFAATYHPVAAEGKLFVPSMIHDSVQALDADTGAIVWTAYAGGPVRFAPVYWQGKVYYGSDDGSLYCVEAGTGKPVWTFRGAPKERMVIGNDRLISTWPVRGGPVLKDGRIYFANGVWPFMGIFVYCLKADTGEVVWVNDGTLEDGASRDQRVMHRPYEACPGGYLTVADDKLLLPAGRMWPSCYDLKTGKRVLYTYRLPIGVVPGKVHGCDLGIVAGAGYWFMAGGAGRWSVVCDAKRGGELVGRVSGIPAVDGNTIYTSRVRELCAYDFAGKTFDTSYRPDDYGGFEKEPTEPVPALWTTRGAKALTPPVKIGPCLYYGTWIGDGKKRGGITRLNAVRIPAAGGQPETVWQTTVDGANPVFLAADAKLFVTTTAGDVMCFGGKPGDVRRWPYTAPSGVARTGVPDPAAPMIRAVGQAGGYALVLGIGSGDLVESLLQVTNRHVFVLDSDAAKVDSFRGKMHSAGLYGSRVAALVGDIRTAGLPPYFAESIVLDSADFPEGAAGVDWVRAAYRCLRPFGGRLCLALDAAGHGRFEAACSAARLDGSKLARVGGLTVLTRQDLPLGTGSWGHADGGNAGRTYSSQDGLIQAPLGALWFGGEGADPALFRSNRGPVCAYEGRAFTFNGSRVAALDVYTGRVLWNVAGPDLAKDKNRLPEFFAPCVDGKGLYFANGTKIVEYEPATGAVAREIPMPSEWGLGTRGRLMLRGDALVLGNEKAIVCVSRRDGRAVWTRRAGEKKALSAAVIGGDRLFFAE